MLSEEYDRGSEQSSVDVGDTPAARAEAKRQRRASARLELVTREVERVFSRVEKRAPKVVQAVEPVAPDLARAFRRFHGGTVKYGVCVFAAIALEGGYIKAIADGCGRPRCPTCEAAKRDAVRMVREARNLSLLKETERGASGGIPPNGGLRAEGSASHGAGPSGRGVAADGSSDGNPDACRAGGRAGRGEVGASGGVQGAAPPASVHTPSKHRQNTLLEAGSSLDVSSVVGPSGAGVEPEAGSVGGAKPGVRVRGRRGRYFFRPRYWKFRAWRRAISGCLEELAGEMPSGSRLRASMERRARAMRACGARVLVRECSGCSVARLGSGIPDDGSGRAVDEMGARVHGPKPCGARSCSFCERRAAAKRATALMSAMRAVPEVPGYGWRFVTVSVPYDTLDPEAVTVEALSARREIAFGVLGEAWSHGAAMHKARWDALGYIDRLKWHNLEDTAAHHRAWWRALSPELQAAFLARWHIAASAWADMSRKERTEVISEARSLAILRATVDGRWSLVRPFVRAEFKLGSKGAAMFARVELGGRGGGHVHAHALVHAPWINQKWLEGISQRMGGGFVWVTEANVSTAREVAKYTVKSCSPLDEGWLAGEQRICLSPKLVARWEVSTFGVRMSRVRGALVGLMSCDEEPDEAPTDEAVLLGAERDADIACTFCGRCGGWRWVVRNMGEWVGEAHERGGAALFGSRWSPRADDDPRRRSEPEELSEAVLT